MKLLTLICSSILLVSCAEDRSQQIETLTMVYEQNAERLRDHYQELYNTVEEAGRRSGDVFLLKQIDSLQQQRVKAGIKWDNPNVDTLLHIYHSEFETYLKLVERHLSAFDGKTQSTSATLQSRISQFQPTNTFTDSEDQLLFELNVMALETLVLEGFNRKMASCCLGCYTRYGKYVSKDSVVVNEAFEMVLATKPELCHPYFTIRLDSVRLTKDQNDVDIKLHIKQVDQAWYLNFIPRDKGVYTLRGTFFYTFEREDYTFEIDFSQQFVVEKQGLK